MKKTALILLAALLLSAAAACDTSARPEMAAPTPAAQETPVPAPGTPEEAPETTETDAPDTAGGQRDTLVAAFSATGTTKGVAEKIAAITDADLYEITAAEPYTADDLNYNDRNSRATREQNDKSARPELGGELPDLRGYTTVYVGFPIWWGEEPRILDTFVERCSFEGCTVIPFCTSGSSGIGSSGDNLEALAGSGTWLDGRRFGGGVSEAELQAWIEELQ